MNLNMRKKQTRQRQKQVQVKRRKLEKHRSNLRSWLRSDLTLPCDTTNMKHETIMWPNLNKVSGVMWYNEDMIYYHHLILSNRGTETLSLELDKSWLNFWRLNDFCERTFGICLLLLISMVNKLLHEDSLNRFIAVVSVEGCSSTVTAFIFSLISNKLFLSPPSSMYISEEASVGLFLFLLFSSVKIL